VNVFHFTTNSYFGELVGDLGSDVQDSGVSTPALEGNGALVRAHTAPTLQRSEKTHPTHAGAGDHPRP